MPASAATSVAVKDPWNVLLSISLVAASQSKPSALASRGSAPRASEVSTPTDEIFSSNDEPGNTSVALLQAADQFSKLARKPDHTLGGRGGRLAQFSVIGAVGGGVRMRT